MNKDMQRRPDRSQFSVPINVSKKIIVILSKYLIELLNDVIGRKLELYSYISYKVYNNKQLNEWSIGDFIIKKMYKNE